MGAEVTGLKRRKRIPVASSSKNSSGPVAQKHSMNVTALIQGFIHSNKVFSIDMSD